MYGIYSARPAHNHSCAASTCASQHHYHANSLARACTLRPDAYTATGDVASLTLAAAAALSNAKIPNVQHGIADEDVDLPVNCWPISCTFAKVGDSVILDPTSDEKGVMAERITVAHDENGNLRAAQKGMNGAFTDAEVRQAVKTARDSDNVLREALKGISG